MANLFDMEGRCYTTIINARARTQKFGDEVGIIIFPLNKSFSFYSPLEFLLLCS